MNRGNSIPLRLKTRLSIENIDRIEVVFGQRGKIVLVKTDDDVTTQDYGALGKFIIINLTEEESYLFEPGRYIPVDITITYTNGTTLTDTVTYKCFNGTVKSNGVDAVQIELDISDTIDRINGEVV